MATQNEVSLDQILGLSFTQVNAYLERVDAEHACEACGKEIEWQVDIDPDTGNALFTTMPLASNIDNGMVYLPLTCPLCSNTRFINAANIARDVISHEAQDDNEQ